MRAQASRIGDAWETLEKKLLTGVTYKTPGGTVEVYKERGLKKEWLDWMKKRHKESLDRLKEALEDKIQVFKRKPAYVTKLKRWDHAGIFSRAVKQPNCGFEKSDKILQERVDLLIKAYENMKPVDSELDLD